MEGRREGEREKEKEKEKEIILNFNYYSQSSMNKHMI